MATSRAVRATGGISFGGVVVTALIVAGVYWLVMFVPVYIDHWEVNDAVQASYNSYGIVNDYIMRTDLENKLREVKFGTHKEFDMMGREVEMPGLPVTPTNPLIEVDEAARKIRIRYEYDRVVHLVPSQKIKVLHMVAEKKGKFAH